MLSWITKISNYSPTDTSIRRPARHWTLPLRPAPQFYPKSPTQSPMAVVILFLLRWRGDRASRAFLFVAFGFFCSQIIRLVDNGASIFFCQVLCLALTRLVSNTADQAPTTVANSIEFAFHVPSSTTALLQTPNYSSQLPPSFSVSTKLLATAT